MLGTPRIPTWEKIEFMALGFTPEVEVKAQTVMKRAVLNQAESPNRNNASLVLRRASPCGIT
jgi:hypothetical protein